MLEDDFDDPGLDASPFPDGRGVVYYPPALVGREGVLRVLARDARRGLLQAPGNPKPEVLSPQPSSRSTTPPRSSQVSTLRTSSSNHQPLTLKHTLNPKP